VVYEHGNEHTGSQKEGEFLKQLSDYWFLKNESTPRCLLVLKLKTGLHIWKCI